LTLSSKDQNVFCIVNCKEDYDNLKLACKPIFQKINTLCEKASIEVICPLVVFIDPIPWTGIIT
jgi:hypothetical protein